MPTSVVHGPYFNHVFHAWAQRHHPNMLFLFYEDRKKVTLLTYIYT